ncbi:lactate dehydrogenase D, isoform CRA_c [Rattus norvegicus]|uniref:Lactate dehydrogenase D, isoform CRA_c n=1 Tax=Rattus norvegicus TaxID=10116 RepID=A6IZ98_RAT|nr:lactate dehydrogenase D, isoform CRA_c [Rattus norvegicus]
MWVTATFTASCWSTQMMWRSRGGSRPLQKIWAGVPWHSMGHVPENMASVWARGSCFKRKWVLWVWRP